MIPYEAEKDRRIAEWETSSPCESCHSDYRCASGPCADYDGWLGRHPSKSQPRKVILWYTPGEMKAHDLAIRADERRKTWEEAANHMRSAWLHDDVSGESMREFFEAKARAAEGVE